MTFNLLLINPSNPRSRVRCQILACCGINHLYTNTCELKNMQTHAELCKEWLPNFTKGYKSTLLCELVWPLSAAYDFLCTITIKGFQAAI